MASPDPTSTNNPKRDATDYITPLPSRSELASHLKTELAKQRPNHKISDFFTKTFWSWIRHYVKSRFGKKAAYKVYTGSDTGVYTLSADGPASIAITSDWATDTDESHAIAQAMGGHDPDYTIHVGDTYFVGAPSEIYSNFVDPRAPWVRGRLGSFAVLGNHEMYARGDAFFECLLPSLGPADANGKPMGQGAGFFCLQNDHWRILGLDTGYHSVGTPILEFLPFCAPKCEFDPVVIDWLRDVVKVGDPADKRGIVILTHHQFISAFQKEAEYQKPADQLSALFAEKRQVLWFWGHEHKLALYQPVQTGNLTVYGRCIGHGGTPVELDSKSFKEATKQKGFNALVAVDTRSRTTIGDTELGHNGYVVLTLDKATLEITSHDETTRLLTETWTADRQTGIIQGQIQNHTPPDCSLTLAKGKDWANAVGLMRADDLDGHRQPDIARRF